MLQSILFLISKFVIVTFINVSNAHTFWKNKLNVSAVYDRRHMP